MSSFSLLLAQDSVNLISAIRQNDFFGVVCLVALTGLSIYSLTVIFYKWIVISRARQQTLRFQRLVDEDGSWESLFAAAKKYPESPIAKLLKETYVECRLENWFEHKQGLPMEGRLDIAKCTIEGVLLKTMSAEETRLLSRMSGLSTITTLSPFIGLFGTVWGVLAAFQALAVSGSGTLAALAPGISTALVTTIFGLFAAIPALVAYNYFMTEIKNLTGSMETFSHELENAVRKQIIKGGAR